MTDVVHDARPGHPVVRRGSVRSRGGGIPGLRPFKSEWKKLLRRGQMLGTWGVMVGVVILVGILLFANAAQDPAPPDPTATQRGPPQMAFATLEAPAGWVLPFTATATLIGIVALVTAASNLAGEYTSGTLKVLLVHEPRRIALLAGKVVAVWLFVAAGVAVALAGGVVVATVMAGIKGIDMQQWLSGDGWLALIKAWGNTTIVTLGWGLMGTMLAVILRAGPPAIGIGIAYPLLVEGLLGLAIPQSIIQFMPGQVFAAVANGGGASPFGAATAGLAYGPALLMMALYVAGFAAVSFALLHRRDVS